MKIPDIIIAVDGCSSTGKSSFAKLLSARFGFLYLDSGALYRGVTLFAQEKGIIDKDNNIDSSLKERVRELDLHFGEGNKLYWGERCIEKEIRSLEVSSQVSPISALQHIRNFVDNILHKLAAGGRVIMDGRDIGVTVFPNAELKIFMTASEEVRAQRRFKEMLSKGENPSFEEVLANIKERDYIDSHREASPLRQAEDAFVLDNSEMTIEEEVCWVQGVIQGKFGILE